MEYSDLSELEVNPKIDWKIKIRLARKWEEINKQDEKEREVHLVFIDNCVSLLLKTLTFMFSTCDYVYIQI